MSAEFDESDHLYPSMTYRKWGRFCRHPSVVVDEASRKVRCELCGCFIDPFDFLVRLSKDQDRFRMNSKALNEEIGRLRIELENLKKEERNTRSRLQRLKAKE